MRLVKYLVFVSLFLVFSPEIYSQATGGKAEKKAEKTKVQKEKQATKAYNKSLKRHKNIQTDETKKRMKQNRRQAKRVRENKRESIWKKLFQKRKK